MYTRYHSRGFATGSERRGYAGYSHSEMEEFKIKEQLFEANGLFGKDLKGYILKATICVFHGIMYENEI